MPHPDHSLIYQARKFITAENVHRVNTWIFCYESSPQKSSRQMRYERLLREFVATRNLMLGLRIQAKVALCRGIKARRASTELDEEIQRCFSHA
jgi:hypothetical protein